MDFKTEYNKRELKYDVIKILHKNCLLNKDML